MIKGYLRGDDTMIVGVSVLPLEGISEMAQ